MNPGGLHADAPLPAGGMSKADLASLQGPAHDSAGHYEIQQTTIQRDLQRSIDGSHPTIGPGSLQFVIFSVLQHPLVKVRLAMGLCGQLAYNLL